MNFEGTIQEIELEWEPDEGFFWLLRQGLFTNEGCRRTLAKLSALSLPSDTTLISRRLASVIWYIPIFMIWQKERVVRHGSEAATYEKAITLMTNEVERILGIP